MKRFIEHVWEAQYRARIALNRPVDAISLGVFRVVFGGLLVFEMATKLWLGWHRELFENPFHFTYSYFEWVKPPGEFGTYALICGLMAVGGWIAVGFAHRLASAIGCLGLTAYFLMERTLYVNHIYLYCLLLGLFSVIPADRTVSIRWWLAQRRAQRHATPCLDTHRGVLPTVPFWALFVLRFQIGIVYTFAGLAKLNPDWLRGYPLKIWLPPLPSVFEGLIERETLALVMSWGGLAFDLSIVPLLLWNKTRLFGLAWAAAFHLSNAGLFGIASFPFMSLALSSLFFEPAWPRRLFRRVSHPVPMLQARLAFEEARPTLANGAGPLSGAGFTVLLIYATIQLAVPLRPYLYPGNPHWTEEGDEFSWRMMLRHKRARIHFTLVDPHTNRTWSERPAKYLSRRQREWMRENPELIRQFARYLASVHESEGRPRPQVFVDAWVKLNQHPYARLVDQRVDLAAEPLRLGPAPWILPLPSEDLSCLVISDQPTCD